MSDRALPADLWRKIADSLDTLSALRLRNACRAAHLAIKLSLLVRQRKRRETRKLQHVAIADGDAALLRLLVRLGYRFDPRIVLYCVDHAPAGHRYQICRYLLSLGYPAHGLRQAVLKDDVDLVRLLADSRSYSSKTMAKTLHACLPRPHLKESMLKQLLGLGSTVSNGCTVYGPFLLRLDYENYTQYSIGKYIKAHKRHNETGYVGIHGILRWLGLEQ